MQNTYNKFSLVLLFIHWLDCNKEKVTVPAIMGDYAKMWHDKGHGKGVTIDEVEAQEILSSLVNFDHLKIEPDGSYSVKPFGRVIRYENNNIPEIFVHPWLGKFPLPIQE